MTSFYAEDVNYWKTSRSSPDSWISKTKSLIIDFGGEIVSEAFGSSGDRSAFLLEWKHEGQCYKMVWPVLQSAEGNEEAARRQAATMLYHDTKAKLVSAKVLGVRIAFFQWLQIPDGRSAYQLADNELTKAMPALLTNQKE